VNIWDDYGFEASPYTPDPVPPTATGERLLVGRADELRRVGMLIASAATHPTIEGDNGVGKTSLVAVASYLARRAFEKRESTQLLIPLERPFQLAPADTQDVFERRLYFAVAEGFLQNEKLLLAGERDIPSTDDVRAWLTSPVFRSGGGGGSAFGFGASGVHGASPNTSAGFTEAGFRHAVDSWLDRAFPSGGEGFICVLDNLELLQTHKAARDLLEALRDSVFNRRGLRWVLCGARGIMRAAAASPRLHGVLADPMVLDPLDDEFVPEVVERRIEVFRKEGVDAYAPVDPDGFRHLYEVGNRNLRNALKYAEDYALWLQIEGQARPIESDEKRSLLEVWMATSAEKYLGDISGVGQRAWDVFDGIVSRGGSISPADFGEFGFETPQAMRGQMRALEGSMLVETSVDETDQRRRLIEVTSKGWIVNYQRSGYMTPRELLNSHGAQSNN
jgi:hypothetical protein